MVFIDLIAANVLKQQANLRFRSEKFLNLELLLEHTLKQRLFSRQEERAVD